MIPSCFFHLRMIFPQVPVNISPWLVAQWLALHSRPVFRDGFLLAYNMWCWNSCWVGSALSFPVGFSSNSKKEAPIGVPGTSIRSVPTLMGEGINTNTRIWLFTPHSTNHHRGSTLIAGEDCTDIDKKVSVWYRYMAEAWYQYRYWYRAEAWYRCWYRAILTDITDTDTNVVYL